MVWGESRVDAVRETCYVWCVGAGDIMCACPVATCCCWLCGACVGACMLVRCATLARWCVLSASARKFGFCVMHVDRTVHTLVMQSALRAWISLVVLRIDVGDVPP